MAAGNVVQIIGTPGNSPALKYELQLLETSVPANSKGGISVDRVNLCLSIFDELIPKLGVFQRVMKLLNNEFNAAIFSEEYTAEGRKAKTHSCHGNNKPTPTKVPYFIIAKKCVEEKDREVSKLKRQIHSLKEHLYTCEADMEKASSTIDGLNHDIKEYESRITGLTSDLQSCTSDNNHLQVMLTELQYGHETSKANMEGVILSLKNTISSHEVCFNDLKPYKATHDKIQKKFSSGKGGTSSATTTQPFSIKSSIERELSVASTLELQILQMRNVQIDQYEQLLDRVNSIRKEDKNKLKVHKEKFRIVIEDIDKELSLLQSHKTSHQSRLHQLQSLNPAHPHKAIVTPTHPYNPLVAQEQPINKYAAMVHISSDDGHQFCPIKEAKVCESCGDKVVLCPHWSTDDLILHLPLNSTHIKFTRPLLLTTVAPPTKKPIERIVDNATPTHSKRLFQTAMDPDIAAIWKHFNNKYVDVCRRMPRELSSEFLLNVMSKFYSTEFVLDIATPTDSTHSPKDIVTSFYQFVIKRYYLKHIALLVLHDLISALERHHQENVYLLVFAHVLGGTTDGVLFRYQLLYAELISAVSCWSTTSPSDSKFTEWCGIVYPDIEEIELEQVAIDFISYSNNVPSHLTVMEYLTLLLIKHRDPSVKQAESLLSDQTTDQAGSMNEAEFAEACLVLCPECDTLAMRLFSQTMSLLSPSTARISIRQLAYILGYVQLHYRLKTLVAQLNEQLNTAEEAGFNYGSNLITITSLVS